VSSFFLHFACFFFGEWKKKLVVVDDVFLHFIHTIHTTPSSLSLQDPPARQYYIGIMNIHMDGKLSLPFDENQTVGVRKSGLKHSLQSPSDGGFPIKPKGLGCSVVKK
jgi:hypothetical protein